MTRFTPSLHGVYAAMVTPFRADGKIDLDMSQRLAVYCAEGGLDGLLPCGTTGEYPLLSFEERVSIFTAVQQAVGQRIQVMANVSSLDLRETARYIEAAQKAGIRCISVVSPYYYGFDQCALSDYFQTVARMAENMEVYLYNIPANAKNPISASLLAELCEACENICGIKDSSMDFMTYMDYQYAVRNRMALLTGNDAQILTVLQAGGDGAVAATAGVFPAVAKGIEQCFAQGDLEGARARQRILYELRSLCRGIMPVVTHKYVLEQLGFPMGEIRMPFRRLTATEQARADAAIASLRSSLEALER